MAATKRNAMNIAEARAKIQTSQLINRVQNHAFGKVDMTKTQMTAALGLLKKVLPDISEQTMTHTGSISLTVVTDVGDSNG